MRGHTPADLNEVAALWRDPAVIEHISSTPSTQEESWTRLLRYIGHWHAIGYGYWVVEDKQSGTFIGEVGFSDFKRDMVPSLDGQPEAGWAFNVNAWGQGYAQEAVTCMFHWADVNLTSESTVCIISPEHHASIRLANKAGFQLQGSRQYRQDTISLFERIRQNGAQT